jgi:pyruvate dehydrogenase E1 component alpha subunit
MDIMAVYEASLKAIERVRSGEGPYFMEIMTYRYRGHSMGDPERYRDQAEIKKWQEQDPIGIYHAYLLDKKIANQNELIGLEKRAEEDVDAAEAFAHSSPDPAPEELFKDIYVD